MKVKEKRIFILTIAFTLIALALMVTYNFVSFYKNAVTNMEAVGNSSLTAEISEIKSYLSQDITTLRVTSDNIDFMLKQDSSSEQVEKYLKFETKKFIEEIDENFTGVYGYINGEYVDGSDWVPDADYVPTERDWYITAAESGGDIVIVPPYVDAQTHEVIISVCRLLEDGESVISLDIVLNHVQEITESINLNDMGYAFIVDENGLVIAHNDANEVGKDYSENADFAELLEKAKESEYFNTEINGESCYVFTEEAIEGWRTVMVISNSKFLKSSRDILVRNILIVIVVYAAVIFFSIFAFRKMKESMEELNRKQQQVESANQNLEHSKDVINKIAYSNLVTDLKNRYAFDEDLKDRLASDYINIAHFDIDNFRSINETFGYDYGDNFLASVASKLNEEFSKYGEIYNITANEFCIVFGNNISSKDASEITAQAYKVMKDKYLLGNIYIQVNVSGVMYRYAPRECSTTSALLVRLESITREIKRNGGNFCNVNFNI